MLEDGRTFMLTDQHFVKIAIISKSMYRFIAIFIKFSVMCFTEIKKKFVCKYRDPR